MTYQEALDIVFAISQVFHFEYGDDFVALDLAKDIVKNAVKKQIPKNAIEICKYGENDLVGICPICNEGVVNEMRFCSECGQALDWSDEE